MTQPSPSARDGDKVYGVWTDTVGELVSYRYLGCRSTMHDRGHATGRMKLRRDMRTPDGLLAAPVAIAMLDTAGINIDRLYHLALTHVEVQLLPAAGQVRELEVRGAILREARTQVFTECRLLDAHRPGVVVGFGTADWAVISPTPAGFEYVDPGPGVAERDDLPPLWEAYEASRRRGGGLVIPGLSPRIGTNTLHHGPILVALEAAALEAAETAAETGALRVEAFSTRLVKAGRQGPFSATAELLSCANGAVACRAQLRDEGADQTVAVGMLRAGVSGGRRPDA